MPLEQISNGMQHALQNALSETNVSEDGLAISTTVTFAGSAAIFEGHFPGMPVVPAVYQVGACRIAVEQSGPYALSAISRSRFSKMCGPDTPYRLAITLAHGPESTEATCTLHDDRLKVLCSKIVLLFRKTA
jgi:3-hydroxymyristoyl/3-hydroxydecanoyl-(acyl carrier protein) dehydratase